MSDPGLLSAKLAAATSAVTDYINNLPDVSYLGIHVKIKDHVTADQISELAADVVDAIDTAEDQYHPAKP